MPEFAEINTQTNEVLRVIGAKSKLWCEYELDGTWFRTYYDTEGKNFAGIGFTYYPDKDNFSAPQPYPSWTLDDQCIWQPPVTRPEGDKLYDWNEETQSWDETKA
ncbi:MAG: hypothetical protein ACKVHS_08975 [Flavobacteriales bacterium]